MFAKGRCDDGERKRCCYPSPISPEVGENEQLLLKGFEGNRFSGEPEFSQGIRSYRLVLGHCENPVGM